MADNVRLGYFFAAIPEWILYHSELLGNDVRVWGVLARCGRERAYPSVAYIAERANISEETVRASRKRLEAVGALYVEARYIDGRQDKNLYHLAGDSPIYGPHPENQDPAPQKPEGTSPQKPPGTSPQKPPGEREQLEPEQHEHRDTHPVLHTGSVARAEKLLDLPTDADSDFDAWWTCYPRRVSKADARKAWATLTPEQRRRAIAVMEDHIRMWIAEGRGTSTIPYPATWLRNEAWDDEINFVPERRPEQSNDTPLVAHLRSLRKGRSR